MKTKTILPFILTAFTTFISAQEISEENFQKIDKEIWGTYQTEADKISAELQLHPEKRDSLMQVYEKIKAIALRKNEEAAMKFASVPGGLQRLFWVRLDLPKDTIRQLWNNIPDEMKTSSYGKSLKLHLDTKQIEEGDTYYDFTATDVSGKKFKLSSLEGKNIILIYDGLSCMGDENGEYLKDLYASSSRNDLEIVAYTLSDSLEKLQDVKKNFDIPFRLISDFKRDHSHFKIKYGAQTRPTVFVIDRNGKIILKTTGRYMKDELEKLKNIL